MNLAALGTAVPPPSAAPTRDPVDLAQAIVGLAGAIDKHLRVTTGLLGSLLEETREAQARATSGPAPREAAAGSQAGTDTEAGLRVVLLFTARARAFLESRPKPASVPQPHDVWPFQHVAVGDFLRVEGYTEIWQVSQRTWHVMDDVSELRLVLDGPVRS